MLNVNIVELTLFSGCITGYIMYIKKANTCSKWSYLSNTDATYK